MNESVEALVVDCVTELLRDGVLDSLALVKLVLAIEDSVEERAGIVVSLADERAVSQTSSPFRTVGTLAAYVELLMREAEWLER